MYELVWKLIGPNDLYIMAYLFQLYNEFYYFHSNNLRSSVAQSIVKYIYVLFASGELTYFCSRNETIFSILNVTDMSAIHKTVSTKIFFYKKNITDNIVYPL